MSFCRKFKVILSWTLLHDCVTDKGVNSMVCTHLPSPIFEMKAQLNQKSQFSITHTNMYTEISIENLAQRDR